MATKLLNFTQYRAAMRIAAALMTSPNIPQSWSKTASAFADLQKDFDANGKSWPPTTATASATGAKKPAKAKAKKAKARTSAA